MAIAKGAAIYAEFCEETGIANYILSDIAQYSYGIRCYENYDQFVLTFKVFETDKAVKKFEIDDVGDYIMEIKLPLPDDVPKNTPVKVNMKLTTDGLIEVVANDSKGHISRAEKHLNY